MKKKNQYQALNGCGFLPNKWYCKDAVGGRNSVSAGKIVMPSNICLCHSTNAKEVPKKKQFFSVICRQIWRDNCQNRILMGVFLADCVSMRGK